MTTEKLTILMVDDEPQILTSVVDLLEDEFLVRTASSGAEALRMLQRERFAVIISDQRMPEMSGDEFLRQALEVSDAVRILLTGYTDVQALARAVNQGRIHAYVAKPWNPVELKVVVANAAEQYRLASRLEHEHAMLQALMDTIPDAIYFKDRDLRFERINAAQGRLLGVGAAVGHRLAELQPGAAAERIEEDESQVLATGKTFIDEEEAVYQFGREAQWLSTTRIPIRNDRGEITGLAAVCRDVTKRKLAEQVLQRSHDDLERAVHHRTEVMRQEVARRAAAEEEARVAREVAETSNRAKSTFLANMSHELRTPLNAIIGFSEMMMRELFGAIGNPVYADYIKVVNESALHLLQIINDILDVSRIEVGQVVLCEEAVDLHDLVAAAVRLIRPAAVKKGHQLEVDGEPAAVQVIADSRIMKQVLLNVLSNAVKFTPDRGTVLISAQIEDDSPVIRVVDSGIGIAAKDLPTVMKPFGQVDTGLARKYEGTGLGLPLSKVFMELHGGTLEITSALGTGTTVTLRLPAERLNR
jgi:two-component system cell cycle sensor histidine kinase PleC